MAKNFRLTQATNEVLAKSTFVESSKPLSAKNKIPPFFIDPVFTSLMLLELILTVLAVWNCIYNNLTRQNYSIRRAN